MRGGIEDVGEGGREGRESFFNYEELENKGLESNICTLFWFWIRERRGSVEVR